MAASHPPSDAGFDPVLLQGFARPLLASLERLAHSAPRAVVALNGPVGAGKTSLCRLLLRQAQERGLRLAVASIDDLYLSWPERQRRLAGNPFGVSRVPPGSHDIPLLLHGLERWRRGAPLQLPRFDKTLRGGQGDRIAGQALEADVLLLEGWLMGCRPLGEARLAALLAGASGLAGLTPAERAWLPHWDTQLAAYGPLWRQCRELWLLWPLHWGLPRRWRFQAEARQRRSGAAWLPPADLERLVRASLFSLPAALYQEPLAAQAAGLARLDGRRRCRELRGPGILPVTQASSPPSASVG